MYLYRESDCLEIPSQIINLLCQQSFVRQRNFRVEITRNNDWKWYLLHTHASALYVSLMLRNSYLNPSRLSAPHLQPHSLTFDDVAAAPNTADRHGVGGASGLLTEDTSDTELFIFVIAMGMHEAVIQAEQPKVGWIWIVYLQPFPTL